MITYVMTCYFPAIPIQGVKFLIPLFPEEATLFEQVFESSPEMIPQMLGGKLTNLKSQDLLVVTDVNGVVHAFETKDVRMSLEILKMEDYTVNFDEDGQDPDKAKIISLSEYRAKKEYEEAQDREYDDDDDDYEDD